MVDDWDNAWKEFSFQGIFFGGNFVEILLTCGFIRYFIVILVFHLLLFELLLKPKFHRISCEKAPFYSTTPTAYSTPLTTLHTHTHPLAKQVASECPVAKALGVIGHGEGIVWAGELSVEISREDGEKYVRYFNVRGKTKAKAFTTTQRQQLGGEDAGWEDEGSGIDERAR